MKYLKEEAVNLMKEYFGTNKKWIEHSLRVLNYTEKLIEAEKITYPFIKNVAILSAIFHDIGIPLSEKKYGNRDDINQEREGGIIARVLLKKLNIRPDIMERVVYIVAHHHTHTKIDGLDFEILWDADLLTNIEEGRVNIDRYPREKGLRREISKKILNSIIKQ